MTFPCVVGFRVKGSDNCEKIKELSILQNQLLNQAIAIEKSPVLSIKQSEDSIESIVEAYKDNVKRNYIFKEPGKAYSYFALFQALGNRLIFNPRSSHEDIRVFAAVATSWDTFYPEAERGKNLHNIALEGMKNMRIMKAQSQATVIARIHEAAKYISLNRLSLSPQCGFASCEIGNKLTDAEQWAKIDLVREISEEVWGSSSFSDAE